MNKITTVFLFVFYFSGLHAQTSLPCAVTNEITPERMAMEQLISEKKKSVAVPENAVLTLPVVFHVIYNSAAENIPDAQIFAQLDTIKKDFRKLNADVVNTPSVWSSLAADAQIDFCLASVDPAGHPTNGITRTHTDSLTFHAAPGASGDHMKYTAEGGMDAWDTHKYVNIWIVNLTNASAFASNPMQHGQASDGIVLNYTTLTGIHQPSHEVGHYLNMFHIYGSEIPNCQTYDGGDMVSDTPDQAVSTHGCPSFPLTDSCTAAAPGIMFMNFMDQTNSTCQSFFTQGQATRMRDAITTMRASLLTSAVCAPASVNEQNNENSVRVYSNAYSLYIKNANGARGSKSYSSLEIFNLQGEKVFSTISADLSNREFNLSMLNHGIYLVKVNVNEELIVKKIMIN